MANYVQPENPRSLHTTCEFKSPQPAMNFQKVTPSYIICIYNHPIFLKVIVHGFKIQVDDVILGEGLYVTLQDFPIEKC